MFPSRWIRPGMIPSLARPGLITPGQLGPTSQTSSLRSSSPRTVIMSRTGIPSVMQAISSSPASIPSRMASAAKGGGT